MRYVHLYNTTLPQSALMSPTPMQAMKDWHKSHPHIFVKTPRNRPGCDNHVWTADTAGLCHHMAVQRVVSPEGT